MQVRLDFEDLNLMDPDETGNCRVDYLQVRLTNNQQGVSKVIAFSVDQVNPRWFSLTADQALILEHSVCSSSTLASLMFKGPASN